MLYRSLRQNISLLSTSGRTHNYFHIFQEHWLDCHSCPCAVHFSSVFQNQLSAYVRFALKFHKRLLNISIHVENNYFQVKFAIKFSHLCLPILYRLFSEGITARVRKFGCCPHKAVLMNPFFQIFFRISSFTKVCIER